MNVLLFVFNSTNDLYDRGDIIEIRDAAEIRSVGNREWYPNFVLLELQDVDSLAATQYLTNSISAESPNPEIPADIAVYRRYKVDLDSVLTPELVGQLEAVDDYIVIPVTMEVIVDKDSV